LLIHLISKLYERTSITITTKLGCSEWVEVFGETKLTTALLYRPKNSTTSQTRDAKTRKNEPVLSHNPTQIGRSKFGAICHRLLLLTLYYEDTCLFH
jgi:hypothetical protein